MEKSDLAGNAVTFLHDENYLAGFQAPVLGADGWLNVDGRERVSLSGEWAFAIDIFDTGFRQRWYAYQPGSIPRAHDWNPFDAQTCMLPAVWNLHQPELFHYEGGAWYCRTISDCRENGSDRLFLRIGAANYCTRIFLDGVFLGRHMGGSTPFCVELSAHMSGSGTLMLHVENKRDPNWLPSHHFDWFNYGGPHREIALFAVPQEHIRDFFLRYNDGTILLDVETTLGLGEATLEIPELGIVANVAIADGRGRARIEALPQLWSPEAPRLFDFTLRAGADVVQDRVGFRTLDTSQNRVLLNGQPVFLRGCCVHEDDIELGRVTSQEDIRRRFRHARELGANFLRLAHYPHHEDVARIADEEGVMLWEEIPAYWSVNFEDADTRADARNQLAELIRRDRNRASVILWGLANETADTPPRNTFLGDLAGMARALDPSRLLGAACLFNQETLTIEDRLSAAIDVVGLNEYFGWYDDNVSDLRRIIDQYALGKPLVISETGCDVVAGHSGHEGDANSEAFGRRYYEDQIAAVKGHANVAGFVPWLLYDFRSARRQNAAQRGWNRKGLIAEDKVTYKGVFNVVAAFYRRCMNKDGLGG